MPSVPRSRYVLFCLLAAAGLAADLGTKAWTFSSEKLLAGEVLWLWPGHVGIQLSWNEGALFGIGQGMVWVFAVMSIVALVGIPAWLFWFRAADDLWLTVALGCVMGGVLGNLYDRLGLPYWLGPIEGQPVYAVRDWILWQWNDQWRWPNFNIADSLLVVGTGILLVHALRKPSSAAGED